MAEKSIRYPADYILGKSEEMSESDTQKLLISETGGILAEMEAALNTIADENPRIDSEINQKSKSLDDLKAILQVSLAVNSSLVLEEILNVVMQKAIELLSAERGFLMLLDDSGELRFKSAHNITKENLTDRDFRISNSIADQVASSGKAVFTSDAQSDDRFSNQKSVLELHLRSIMCVPLKIKSNVIGIIYLDNSSQAKFFLKSDLFLFQLFAQQAAQAIHNATLYDHLMDLKVYNEKVVNRSPVGIVVIDSSYNLISINDAALNALDKNRENIVLLEPEKKPSKFLDLIPLNEFGKWRQMIDIALTTNQPFEDARYFHNTGYDEKALSVKITPISKLPYGGDGLILTIEDITEKVIMERYVILSEKLVARGEMASSIAHELNNYLAIISNNAELLGLNLSKESYEKAENNSQQISEAISKMKRFTDGLIDFSKLETDIIDYDIRHLIEELLFSLKAQNRFKKITVSLDMAPNLPKVAIDVGQVQQVFMNMLYNASDAIEEKVINSKEPEFDGKIVIAAAVNPVKEEVLITVSDNGTGIQEEFQTKIFQPHFTTKKSGHGLGLANCKKIINNHKGTLTLTSEPGKGTTFHISLPIGKQKKT
jgi:signal transduction histidine kinase